LRISAPALTLSTDHSAEIKRVGGALYVLRGWVSFEVDKVAAGQAPTRVVVSGGTIEVLGTRFIVFEEGGAGHVDLLEGAISFVAHTGGATPIEPGHRLSWRASTGSSSVEAEASEAPPATPMAPASASSGPVRRAPIRVSGPAAAHEAVQPDPPAPEPDLRSALRHIARLRAAGRSSEALARLTELLVQHAGDRQVREVLSFERIRVLADELGEQESACRAIRDHRAEFGEESYRSAIVAIELKRCPGW
jgi:transmembrane sensor